MRLYEAVLATGPVFVHVFDREMNSRWSSSALRPELGHQPATGVSAEENFGFLHPDDRDQAQRNADELLRGGAVAPRRMRVRDADGEWRWLAVLAANLLDEPDIGSIVVHSWDVTEAVRHEEEVHASQRLLTALLDTLDEGVVVVSDGEIAFANARIRDFFPKVDPPGLIGRPAVDAQHSFAEAMADPAGFVEAAQAIVAAGEIVRNRFVETADGRILEQHFLPVRTGEHSARRTWVYRDVTAQLNLERRQRRLLEMERASRRSVEDQNDRLRELDELKTAFVATVSHELRTPLSALRSYIDLLLDPDGDPLNDEQRGIADAVKRSSLRLGRLVDDLLVLAQLQTRSLPLERTDVAVSDAVAEAIDEVRRVAPPDVAITQQLDPGPSTVTDRVRLTQIVSNLLGNAAKFAHSEVRCTAGPIDSSWIIEITDDGPGIAPDELERVFEPFYRGRPGGRMRQGTGLGLPISVQLTELLGGSLTVKNDDGLGGVVARVTVPIVGTDRDGTTH